MLELRVFIFAEQIIHCFHNKISIWPEKWLGIQNPNT